MKRVTLATLYIVFMLGIVYSAYPFASGACLDAVCCSYHTDCQGHESGKKCCDTGACSAEHPKECLNGCQDALGNYYCPGHEECLPIIED